MANRIMLNETSYHGSGAIQEIATEAKARAFKKAFVCSDPDLIKFGVTGKVTKVLDDAGLEYEIYSDIKANPTIENVKHGVESFKAAQADYIIAIGGGSSMDTAKAIGIIIANPEFRRNSSNNKTMCTYYCRTYNSRNCSRSNDQLCNYRC
jgi:lactaldehyde reductase